MSVNPSIFPFSSLSNADLASNFSLSPNSAACIDNELKKILSDTLSDGIVDMFEFDYYTPCQLNNLANRYKNNIKLTMFHVNVRSLNCNYSKLVSFLQTLTFSFDIIVLSEIWSTNLSYYAQLLKGYEFFFDLPDNRIGGVGIYVKDTLNATQTYKYLPSSFNTKLRHYESVWIEVCFNNLTTVIGGYYRHPNTPIKEFSNDFSFSLDKTKNVKYCYILGDLNICLAKYSHNNAISEYVDVILDSKYLPYVYLPTRITKHSNSIIDHVYTNNLFIDGNICKTGLVVSDIADHCANFMFVIRENIKQCSSLSLDPIRISSKYNVNKFNNLLNHTDWSNIYNCTDINVAFNRFTDRLNAYHDSCFPLVIPKNRRSDKKWITPGLIKSINTKCKLYKKWIKTKKARDETKYKSYAKLLKRSLELAEKQYYNNLFDSKINGIKSIWTNINSLINSKQPKCSEVKKIIKDGITIDQSTDIANEFNNYFCEISDRLYCSNAHVINRVNNDYGSYLGHHYMNSFYCSAVTLSELLNIVHNLKTSKSCVGNSMSASLLKDCIDHISSPLLYLCNLSFEQGIFPDQLKMARVVPVFKKGSKLIVSNYRPISITNPFGKVLEKMMHSRMMSYLDKFKILYDYQFGFRKNHSTSFAVIDVVNMIQNQLHEGNYVMGIFMDLQKAFDTINFKILLDKLEHYGFRGSSLNWFKTYLTGRTQFTVVGSSKSTSRITSCGVPQGTVLGPLLFLLYINDITNSVCKSKIKLFADDSNLFVVSNNLPELFNIANSELSSLSQWIRANKLYINYDKTNYMIFEPSRHPHNFKSSMYNAILLFNGFALSQVHSVKYLGLFIDDKLNWCEHVNFIASKVASLTGILYRVKNFLPMSAKRNIYFALIYSVLTYCVEVYANISKSSLNPLIIKCNRLLRLLQQKPRRTPLYDLYTTFGTLPVDLLFEFYTGKFIHKCLWNSASMPSIFSDYFVRGTSLHTYNTRHRDNFLIQSKYSPKTILFYGPSMWSKLPHGLQNNPSLNSFLEAYKLYLSNRMKV